MCVKFFSVILQKLVLCRVCLVLIISTDVCPRASNPRYLPKTSLLILELEISLTIMSQYIGKLILLLLLICFLLQEVRGL